MTTNVNGGVKGGFWTEGALAFYTVTLPAGALNDIIAVDTLEVVPDGTLDVVVKVTGGAANIVGIEYAEAGTTVKLALARSGWTAATLQTAIQAVGTISTNKYTSSVSDVITTASVAFGSATVATQATFIGVAA